MAAVYIPAPCSKRRSGHLVITYARRTQTFPYSVWGPEPFAGERFVSCLPPRDVFVSESIKGYLCLHGYKLDVALDDLAGDSAGSIVSHRVKFSTFRCGSSRDPAIWQTALDRSPVCVGQPLKILPVPPNVTTTSLVFVSTLPCGAVTTTQCSRTAGDHCPVLKPQA